MKKKCIFIFVLFCICVLSCTLNVKADTTCVYSYNYELTGHSSNTELTIDSSGGVTAIVTMYNNQTEYARAKAVYDDFPWDKDDNGNYQCPLYILIYKSSNIFEDKYTVYLSSTKEQMDGIIDYKYSKYKGADEKLQEVTLASGPKSDNSVQKDAESKTSSYISLLNDMCTSDAYSECEDSTATCPLCSCQDSYKRSIQIAKVKYNQVDELITDGYITSDSDLYKEFSTAYTEATNRCENLVSKVTTDIEKANNTGTDVTTCEDLIV